MSLTNAQVVQQWEKRFNGPTNPHDRLKSVLVDPQGNVIVVGETQGASGWSIIVLKYSSSGHLLWSNGRLGVPYAAVVDSHANVIVTGQIQVSPAYTDILTVKYSANGQVVWERAYNGPSSQSDVAFAIAVDSEDDVYVAGTSHGGGTTRRDFTALKYSPAGLLLWTTRHNGPSNDADDPTALSIDPQDNLIITGFFWYDLDDHLTIKLNAQGQLLWERTYSSGLYYNERPNAVACDQAGNIFIAGSAWNIAENEDFYTYKYTLDGWRVWDIRYDAPGVSGDAAFGIALHENSLYVAGNSSINGAPADIVVVKYRHEGSQAGDVNGDGCVNDIDLLAVLFAFGQTGIGWPEDLNFDQAVDDQDLLLVLLNFGQGC